MANTYILLASSTLSNSTSSITFSSIPSYYTDLVLKVSARMDVFSVAANIALSFNGTTTGYSWTRLTGNGSSDSSSRGSNNVFGQVNDDGNTADAFGVAEIYIPSYSVNQNKQTSTFSVQETNSATAVIGSWANLWSNTNIINSITITEFGSGSWKAGSNFRLYGIKNS